MFYVNNCFMLCFNMLFMVCYVSTFNMLLIRFSPFNMFQHVNYFIIMLCFNMLLARLSPDPPLLLQDSRILNYSPASATIKFYNQVVELDCRT